MATHDSSRIPSPPFIERRPDLGLTISGTRITLYDLLDYLHEDWPLHLIRDWLSLSDEQVRVGVDYINAHREAVETEYRQMLAAAEASRQYWEERNRERFAAITTKHASAPPDPRRAAFYAKQSELRARPGREAH